MKIKYINQATRLFILLVVFLTSCEDSFLDEKPLDQFSPNSLLIDKAGFETALNALYAFARDEHGITYSLADDMCVGTDIATAGVSDTRFFNDYRTINPTYKNVVAYWDWCYTKMLKQSNMIISNSDNPFLEISEKDKMAFVAEAQFFRAWTYNVMVNLFGGIPIIDKEITEPRFDFTRASRLEVLEFIKTDLELAVEHLPVVENESNGRIFQAAAYHLLSDVYISLGLETGDQGYYDKSIEAATKVINGECGHYQIMTERFGDTSREGDVFGDLFYTNQQNRSSGNLEVIWAWQFENFTDGHLTSVGDGNATVRMWNPRIDQLKTPDGRYTILYGTDDKSGRGIGNNTPLNYWKYDIWHYDPNDIRNSKYNVRREFYYNNPESEYYGQKVNVKLNSAGKAVIAYPDGTLTNIAVDTARAYYPWIAKTDGVFLDDDPSSGRTPNDIIKMRLAETYLLRAEAYFRKGENQSAASDINVVRSRAKAKPVSAAEVSIDFILDERARELIIEEPRRRTLVRMGLLYKRATTYNWRAAATMEPFNELYPIPQEAIDANTGAELTQNPGYPGSY